MKNRTSVSDFHSEKCTAVLFIRIEGLDSVCEKMAAHDFASIVTRLHSNVQSAAIQHGMAFVDHRRDSFVCVSDISENDPRQRGHQRVVSLAARLQDLICNEICCGMGLTLRMGVASGTTLLLGSCDVDGVWTPRSVLSMPGDAVDLAEKMAENRGQEIAIHASAKDGLRREMAIGRQQPELASRPAEIPETGNPPVSYRGIASS